MQDVNNEGNCEQGEKYMEIFEYAIQLFSINLKLL